MSTVFDIAQKQRKIHPNSLANLKKHAFKKGQSGNPGGQQKGVVYVAEAYKRLLALDASEIDTYKPQTVAEKIALTQIRTALANAEDSLAAAKEIADRTEGKPQQIKSVKEDRTITVRFERPELPDYGYINTDTTPDAGEDYSGSSKIQRSGVRETLRQVAARTLATHGNGS